MSWPICAMALLKSSWQMLSILPAGPNASTNCFKRSPTAALPFADEQIGISASRSGSLELKSYPTAYLAFVESLGQPPITDTVTLCVRNVFISSTNVWTGISFPPPFGEAPQ